MDVEQQGFGDVSFMESYKEGKKPQRFPSPAVNLSYHHAHQSMSLHTVSTLSMKTLRDDDATIYLPEQPVPKYHRLRGNFSSYPT